MTGIPTDIGTILVRMGAVTMDQLQQAVHLQRSGSGAGTGTKLGEILIAAGVITHDTLREALAVQESLRVEGDTPIAGLTRLFNNAIDNRQKKTLERGALLDGMLTKAAVRS